MSRPASIPRDQLAMTSSPTEPHWQPRRGPGRWAVRKFACPQCGAEPGQPCQGRRGDRKSHHADRVAAAELERNRRKLIPWDQRLQPARTAAKQRPAAAQSRGAVSLDGDDVGATIRASLAG